jgi:hypothetical protein
VVSRAPRLKDDNDGRQKADSGTGAGYGEASWSQWLARAWRSPRSTPPNNPGSLRDQPERSSYAGHHGVEVATLQTNRGYACGICEGIAVRAGELSLCVGRICVVCAGGAYALALLAIGALGESVSLPRKTKPERRCHRNPRPIT